MSSPMQLLVELVQRLQRSSRHSSLTVLSRRAFLALGLVVAFLGTAPPGLADQGNHGKPKWVTSWAASARCVLWRALRRRCRCRAAASGLWMG